LVEAAALIRSLLSNSEGSKIKLMQPLLTRRNVAGVLNVYLGTIDEKIVQADGLDDASYTGE
jgi:hypothetical protein